uniref:Uncharacterized protein n=1 Tax=Podarcis muralis TaxID=64176 RepID=A0A670IJJ6_PODMU
LNSCRLRAARCAYANLFSGFFFFSKQGPSRKATDKRPSKKLKCEKKSLAKREIQGVDFCAGTSHLLFPKETADKAASGVKFPHLKMMLQSEGKENVEEENEEEEEEEESCGTRLSDDSEMEPEVLSQGFKLDNSIFLNEDSNQPLPVDRFFGSVAFMQVGEGGQQKEVWGYGCNPNPTHLGVSPRIIIYYYFIKRMSCP